VPFTGVDTGINKYRNPLFESKNNEQNAEIKLDNANNKFTHL
jgi:hypothetical protein